MNDWINYNSCLRDTLSPEISIKNTNKEPPKHRLTKLLEYLFYHNVLKSFKKLYVLLYTIKK